MFIYINKEAWKEADVCQIKIDVELVFSADSVP